MHFPLGWYLLLLLSSLIHTYQSATVMSICWGATDFGKGRTIPLSMVIFSSQLSGYDLANQSPYLDDMLRWSLDWLIKVSIAFFYHVIELLQLY